MGSRPSDFALTRPGPLRLYSTAELLALPPPEWLIDPIMPTGALVGLYGEPWSGKSFVAIDMALCVASGLPWHGFETRQGFALYVSAEGGTGIGKRVLAWLTYHQLPVAQAHVAWLTESIPIYGDSGNIDQLLDRINEIENLPSIVVLDTLARCFDGDENQQEDMGRFIAGVDRLRHEFGATVIVVHHTRLDATRERGNTAFRGAADTMIVLEPHQSAHHRKRMTLTCNKQKDSEDFDPITLSLKVVPGTDSCVTVAEGQNQQKRLQILQILEILRKKGPLTWDQWLRSTRTPETTFKRYVVDLRENDQIIKENGKWRAI